MRPTGASTPATHTRWTQCAFPKTCAAISCLQYCRIMTVSRIAHPSKSIGTASWFQKVMVKYWYPFLTRRWDAEDVLLLNYGYEEDPPMGLPLAASDEPSRYNIQLYHRTATQADLSGKQVLEVSCGHGGGASYLVRTLGPASYTGLDLNADAIAFCRKRHSLPGLDFVHGDAQNLPFADESFDAVINVEASHGYPDFPRFLAEVARVLRPGGRFLYVDFRSYLDFSGWEAAIADAPMRVVSERVINPEVLRGLDKNCAAVPGPGRSPPARRPTPLRPPVRRCARLADVPRTGTGTPFVPDVLLRQGLSHEVRYVTFDGPFGDADTYLG